MGKSVEETRRELFESLFPDDKVYWNGSGYYPMLNSGLGDGVLGYCLTREKHLGIFNAALSAVEIKLPKAFINEYPYRMKVVDSVLSLNLGLKISYSHTN